VFASLLTAGGTISDAGKPKRMGLSIHETASPMQFDAKALRHPPKHVPLFVRDAA
jgi:hypothetical protein